MNEKPFNIVLGMTERKIVEVNGIVNRDVKGNEFTITLIEGDEPYDITGAKAIIYFCNSKGQIFVQEEMTVTKASLGQFSMIPRKDIIAEAGLVIAEVVVKSGEQIDTSQQFTFKVRQSIGEGTGFVPIDDIPNYRQDIALMQKNLDLALEEFRDTFKIINTKIDNTDKKLDNKINDVNNSLDKKINDVDKVNDSNLQAHKDSHIAHKSEDISYKGTINQANVKDALDSTQEQINAMTVGGIDVDPRLSQALVDVKNKRWDNFKAEQDYWQQKTLDNQSQIKDTKTIPFSTKGAPIAPLPKNIIKGLFRVGAQAVAPINNLLGKQGSKTIIRLARSSASYGDVATGLNISGGKYFVIYNLVKSSANSLNSPLLKYTAGGTIYENFSGGNNTTAGRKVWKVEISQSVKGVAYGTSNLTEDVIVKDFMIIKASADEFNLSADEILTKYKYVEGFCTCSENYDLVVPNPQQLFDGKTEPGSIVSATGICVPDSTRTRSSNFILVTPNTTISVSPFIEIIVFYDMSGNGIGNTQSKTFMIPENCYKIKWRALTSSITGDVIINKGSALLPHIPYAPSKTELSVPPEYPLVQLPNGNKNIIAKEGYNVEVANHAMKSEDIISIYDGVSPVTTARVNIMTTFGVADEFFQRGGIGMIRCKYPEIRKTMSHLTSDDVGSISTTSGGTYVDFIMTKGTTLAEARTKLSGMSFYYQISKPFTIKNGEQEYQAPTDLIAYLNGDFITYATSIKESVLNNSTTITLDQECIEIVKLVGVQVVNGKIIETKLNGTLGEDGKTITLDKAFTGSIKAKGKLHPKLYINVEVNGNIAVNMGAKVVALEKAQLTDQEKLNNFMDMQNLFNLQMDYRITIVENK